MQITANGITLDVETHGDADNPALVLIRGLGSQRIHWAPQLIAGFTGAGFHVVTFDNRDVGGSQRFPDTPAEADAIAAALEAGETPAFAYTLDDMARDVTGLMDALGIAQAHVFGISMGGAITQRLLLDHAARLRTATVVMSAARLGQRDTIGRVLVRDMDRAAFIDAAVETDRAWGSPGFPAPEDWTRDIAARAWDRGAEAAGVNRQVLAIMGSEDRSGDLARVTTPTLVIHGRDDALIPWEAGHDIATRIPKAEWELIDGMGHIITPSLAPVIAARVSRFITEAGA